MNNRRYCKLTETNEETNGKLTTTNDTNETNRTAYLYEQTNETNSYEGKL